MKELGDVYVVRLPVSDGMLKIENQLMPDFDMRILSLANTSNVNYINFMPQRAEFKYTDGHHLVKASSDMLSQKLAKLIKQNAE